MKDRKEKIKEYINKEGQIVIEFQDIFTYMEHNIFINLFKKHPPKQRYLIDLRKVNKIDSAALGMLLLLREHNNGKDNSDIAIMISSNLKSTFDNANFIKLFDVSGG
mgnify:CR=1 FL=1|jgi:HptB-dependent secretion and biofilm anti anti-sigma factor